MSFRLFIYYTALCGGWAALFGWVIGRILIPEGEGGWKILSDGANGMFLGLMIALGVGLVDAFWNLSLQQLGQILARVGVALAVGLAGGLLGGLIGGGLYYLMPWAIFVVFGWTLTGVLIGASVGVFDVASQMARRESTSGGNKKLLRGVLGGAVGGVLGSTLYLLLKMAWTGIFRDKAESSLWSPSLMGFVALGMCIGLLIGLAQVILKEAWVKVEQGFRAGREMILTKEKTSVGRAEGSDIALFGDMGVEKLHAHIIQAGNRYFLEDAGSPGGTFINDKPISGRTPLTSGDLIRVGKSVLCFRERAKRT